MAAFTPILVTLLFLSTHFINIFSLSNPCVFTYNKKNYDLTPITSIRIPRQSDGFQYDIAVCGSVPNPGGPCATIQAQSYQYSSTKCYSLGPPVVTANQQSTIAKEISGFSVKSQYALSADGISRAVQVNIFCSSTTTGPVSNAVTTTRDGFTSILYQTDMKSALTCGSDAQQSTSSNNGYIGIIVGIAFGVVFGILFLIWCAIACWCLFGLCLSILCKNNRPTTQVNIVNYNVLPSGQTLVELEETTPQQSFSQI